MTFPSKTSSIQAYTMLLYRNALHPEFFEIEARQTIRHGDYDFESWVFRGGHAARFEHAGRCIAEVVTDQVEGMPRRGLANSLPCAGERDHSENLAEDIGFMTSMQTETLSEHLYISTYNELIEHADSQDAVITTWTDADGKQNLSMVDLQRYNTEVHVQGYHLRSDCGLVLRTQSIMQIGRCEQPEPVVSDETDLI